MEAFQAAVESLSEAEHLDLRKVSKEKNFIQVFAFTASCNWLDIVEVHFHASSGIMCNQFRYNVQPRRAAKVA